MAVKTISGDFISGPIGVKQIPRFNEKYWNADGQVSTRIGLVSSPGTIKCYAELQMFSDYVGLIWKSTDTDSHPLTRYATDYDYTGITFSFTYQTSANFTAFADPSSEPVMTINYNDGSYVYISLLAYASPGYTDHSANVVLNFDTIKGGSFFDEGGPGHGGGTFVPTSGIAQIQFGIFAQYYDPANNSPINTGAYTAGDSIWLSLSNMTVTSNPNFVSSFNNVTTTGNSLVVPNVVEGSSALVQVGGLGGLHVGETVEVSSGANFLKGSIIAQGSYAWNTVSTTITPMSSPPTATTNTTSQISGSVLITPDNENLLYSGSNPSIGGLSATVGYPTQNPTNSPAPLVIDFVYTGTQFEVSHNSESIQCFVNGQPTTAYHSAPITGFASEVRRYNFGTSATRRIRLILGTTYFIGIYIEPTGTIGLKPSLTNGRLIWASDSLGVGSYATPLETGFVGQIRQFFDCDLWNSSVGGTGYLNDGGGGGSVPLPARMISDVYNNAPDVFVMCMGANDVFTYTTAQVNAVLAPLFSQMNSSLVGVKVIVIGPNEWNNTMVALPVYANMCSELQSLCAAHGWPYIDQGTGKTYNKSGTLVNTTSQWITGTGYVGNPQGDGNADTYISSDGVHPTNAGHDYLAGLLVTEIQRCLNMYTSGQAKITVALSGGTAGQTIPSGSAVDVLQQLPVATQNAGVNMTIGVYQSPPLVGHGIANDFDSTYNVTPQRLIEDWINLGFTSVDHYTGVRPYSLVWNSGLSRFIIDDSKATNTAYNAFHADFAARLIAANIPFTFAMSFELYGVDIPPNWDQQDWNNNSAETGYANYTTLSRFNNSTVSAFIKACWASLVSLVPSTALFTAQLGEYAWWAGTYNGPTQATIGPCIFDYDTRVAYNTATGLFAPEIDAPIVNYSSLSTSQKAYIDWCRGSLGAFCDSVAAAIRSARSSTKVSFLFYNDAISDIADPINNGYMQQLNLPYEHWKASSGTYDLAEGEMYGNTTPQYQPFALVDIWTKITGSTSTTPNLGYSASKTRFYTGIAQDPDATMNQPQNFTPMIAAANDAVKLGFSSIIWWAWTQFVQCDFYLYGGVPLSISQITGGVPNTFPPSLPSSGQIRTFTMQVYRSGNWVNIPVQSADGKIQKGQAGVLTANIKDNPKDAYRSQLYEGEKIRAYRGVVGNTQARCWTGYVDAPTVTDNQEVSRSFAVTDYVKELADAYLLQGMIFDNVDPMLACATVMQHALDTFQIVLTDDNNNALTSTAGYNSPSGNQICYFPTLYNPDGSDFVMASGQLGSYTSGPFPYASLSVPIASGAQGYTTYTLPNQYLIASMTSLLGFTIATGSSIPPASGSAVIDYFNGIIYFNPADSGKILYASSTYFASPLWAYAQGTRIMDVISEIMDKSGCRWGVDQWGKFWAQYIDTTVAPTRLFTRGEYVELSVQTNRDRRNVIVCQGWNDVLSQLIVAKAVNLTDIENPPPLGLGKRSYMIVQDQSWRDQNTTNAAANYAMQQVGKRGKIASVETIDDPSLSVRNVIGFIGALPETLPGNFFWIDSLTWSWSTKNGEAKSRMNLSGQLTPGQGLAVISPVNTVDSVGAMNFLIDPQPLASCALSPPGGKYSSVFSIAAGLNVNFSEPGVYTAPDGHGGFIALHGRAGTVTFYGSDGSVFGPWNLSTAQRTGGNISFPVSTSAMTPGALYVLNLNYTDPYGNVGYYRDFITAQP